MNNQRFSLIPVSLWLCLLTSCTNVPQFIAPSNFILVSDQSQSGGNILVDIVETLQANTWIALWLSDPREWDQQSVPIIVGSIHIGQGSHENLAVPLLDSLVAGQQVWAVLHSDNGKEGSFDFVNNPRFDLPLTSEMAPMSAEGLVFDSFTIE